MSAFSAINLADLPSPDVVEQIDYEQVLSDLKADLIARMPELETVLSLESEPVTKLMEAFAYREAAIQRARVNDACKAVMLPYSQSNDLDQLGALMGVGRQVVTEATEETAAVMESDARFRARIALAPEAYTVAGSRGAYIWHALAADPTVKDVSVYAPEVEGDYVGEVVVTILSTEGTGVPDAALLNTVTAAITDEQVRPLTDRVLVQAATVGTYTVNASLWCYEGPDPATVVAAAQAACEEYVDEHHALGHDITLSGLYHALHQPGVQRVAITNPAGNITVDQVTAQYCTAINLTYEGTAL